MGYRAIIGQHVADWGIAQKCLCEPMWQGHIARYGGDCQSGNRINHNAPFLKPLLLRTVSRVLSDRKVLFKHKMAVNSR